MTIPRSALVLALIVRMTAPALAAEPARDLYRGALARERIVRAAMAADKAPSATPTEIRADVRAAVDAYQALVRRYPASGYADDALWQAARLSLDAFEKFGDLRDRTLGGRLLRALAAKYPTSKLVN